MLFSYSDNVYLRIIKKYRQKLIVPVFHIKALIKKVIITYSSLHKVLNNVTSNSLAKIFWRLYKICTIF